MAAILVAVVTRPAAADPPFTEEAAARGLGRVALPALGCVHGRMDPDRFGDLLHAALTRAVEPPDEVWVMADDARVLAALRPVFEEAG